MLPAELVRLFHEDTWRASRRRLAINRRAGRICEPARSRPWTGGTRPWLPTASTGAAGQLFEPTSPADLQRSPCRGHPKPHAPTPEERDSGGRYCICRAKRMQEVLSAIGKSSVRSVNEFGWERGLHRVVHPVTQLPSAFGER